MTEPTPDFLHTPGAELASAFGTSSVVDLDDVLKEYEAEATQEKTPLPGEPPADTPDTLPAEESESADFSQPSPEQPRSEPKPIHPETVRILHLWMDSSRLQKYVRNRIGVGTSDTTVDDVCQEVFMALIKGWCDTPPHITKDDDEGDSRWGLMYGIAAHKVADHFRRTGRNKSDPVEGLPDTDPCEGADKAFFAGWDQQHIWEVVLKIANTPDQVTRLKLMMSDLSAREKANILGKEENNVRVNEHRLRAKIGKELRKQFGGQEIAFGYFVPEPSPEERAPKTRSKKKDSPPSKKGLAISEIRDATIERLHAACEKEIAQGGVELPAHIPAYLGAWTTAISALDRLREDDMARPSAIIFPHTQLLPAFRTFVNDTLNDRAALYQVETSETIATWLGTHSFEFVIAPDDMDKALEEQLRAKSSFILRLLQASPPETKSAEASPAFNAPSYRSLGSKATFWSLEDSVRYLREWRFATGQEMVMADARRLAVQGIGPTLPRLTKDMSYPALKTEAGYDAPE